MAAVRTMLSERGTVSALRHRRHTQWRLMRLAEIDLSPVDRATVVRFRQHACESEGLPPRRLFVIGALEMKYQAERLEAALQRATRIADEMEALWFSGPSV